MNLNSHIFKEIDIKTKDFFPMLYWCMSKFILDPSSRQGIGGREDKIGGFIDRFSNQCINWLIFNHILSDFKISVDPDYFFYDKKSAKKCPDILGVKKNGRLFPFTLFNKDIWEHVEGMPFIEIKALRKDQNLAALSTPQFDKNHYYCYVETDFDQLYLLNIFQETLLDHHRNMIMDSGYIKDNSQNIIQACSPLKKPSRIGTMKLINIIKGDQVQKHFMKCEEGIKPYYYDSFESIEESSLKSTYKKNPISIENGRIKFERSERDLNIPFYIEDNDVKEVHNNKNFAKSSLKIYSKKPFFLNNEKIPSGYSNLKFKKFDRAKKETEYCN